ncbi:Ig-like and fibronectin type-III domain-containing protein 1 isoform X2 [Chrysoperla carnea]|uniref:Ig-like and fibronectin type-III domain-containing protein 1 isoform X2 n=1 Tax=Chrysoperla carnea TaxID=189513 RepID=UPI001D09065B|nr:Ig-like and fibronectin type-III domain-containing protein 1 isoform X2 [Chrysoperla carnea]
MHFIQMDLRFLLFASLLIYSYGGQPGKSHGNQNVHVYEGDDALITCVVWDNDDGTVLWKLGDKILTANSERVTHDKRISVLHDESGDVWVLVIKNSKPSDSGSYVCEKNSEDITRSFHQLSVLSRALQPPNNTTDTFTYDQTVIKDETTSTIGSIRNHNYTDCCLNANVSDQCLGFCNIDSILDGTTGQDPENCETDFPSIVRCMADYRNHVPCCQEQNIPDLCQDVCRGEYTMITDNIKTHFSCSAYTEQTLTCIATGIELLPSPPERVEVESIAEKALKITWSLPLSNADTITEYLVNLTSLRSFDAHLIDPSETSVTPKTNTKESMHIQIKVPKSSNFTVINDLKPFTMYEITVTSLNKHGSSLPSYTVRALTQTPGKLRPTVPSGKAPKLPNTRECCIRKGITHDKCVDRLCDPIKAAETKVTDVMICAPWAIDSFQCLMNGIDHTPCCKERGLPELCQSLCNGNITQLDHSYFKCIKYMGEYTNCLLQGYGVVPSNPTRVHLTNIATDYAILHWNAPKTLGDTVDHYNIHIRLFEDTTQYDDVIVSDEYMTIPNVHPPYILENLQSDSDYEVYVEAANVHGVGEPSSRLVFRTQSNIVEEKIEEATFYNVTACCVESGLSEMCMPLCSYDAKMSDLRSLAGVCAAEFHKLLKCGAGGRNHGGCCSRRGVPNSCLSLCSGVILDSVLNTVSTCVPFIGNIVQCFEEGAGILPGPINELHAIATTDSSVTIEWTSPNDGSNVTNYVVHFQKVDNTSMHETLPKLDQQINTTDTQITIHNLDKTALYHLFVVSQNDHGTSLPSSILVINITKMGIGSQISGVTSPPHSLAVSSHSATWVTITWQPPEFSHPSELITYRVHHKSRLESAFTVVNTTVTSFMLDKLHPNTQYIVFVTAITEKGQSLESETLIVWTDPAYPAFVEAPTVHPINLVMEGSSMTILCIAMGTPLPTISLYISGRLVRQETTRHMVTVIHNVTRDMDQISCYADNGYGTPMQASRKITISYIPHIQASGITLATRGASVKLECKVDSFPAPKMLFWRDPVGRVPVIQGGHYDIKVLAAKDEDSKYIMRLTIDKMTDMDEGEYFCHAENAFGSATQPVSVRIRNTASSANLTQCCMEQNVTSPCMDACSFFLDIDAVIDKPECINDFDKLMKCAADGSDHRSCCAHSDVPRRCLDWCRGEPLANSKMCVVSYTKQILSCFHEGRDKLPGPPQNVHVNVVDSTSVRISWDPPTKNPHTVEMYRVIWRVVDHRTAYKNDTSNTSLTISGLKDGERYECVVKAGNTLGTSTLTDPVQFTMGEKYVISTSNLSDDSSSSGVVIAVILALIVVAALVVGAVWFVRTKKLIGLKNLGGVAFENPSYLREVNMDHIQIPSGQQETNVSSSNGSIPNGSVANGVAVSQTSGGHGWKQESLHVPQAAQEVNPTLYEELKLGSDGAGFKRLKP